MVLVNGVSNTGRGAMAYVEGQESGTKMISKNRLNLGFSVIICEYDLCNSACHKADFQAIFM